MAVKMGSWLWLHLSRVWLLLLPEVCLETMSSPAGQNYFGGMHSVQPPVAPATIFEFLQRTSAANFAPGAEFSPVLSSLSNTWGCQFWEVEKLYSWMPSHFSHSMPVLSCLCYKPFTIFYGRCGVPILPVRSKTNDHPAQNIQSFPLLHCHKLLAHTYYFWVQCW